MNSPTEVTAQGIQGWIPVMWQNARVRALLQVLFLIGMGALTTVAKGISLPLGIPGHSGLFWLGVMVAGRTFVRRNGAATLMGASVAFWVYPLAFMHLPDGLATNGLFYNLGLYGGTGLALDLLARLPKVNIRNPLGAVFCGAMAHLVKFGFIFVPTLFSPVVRHFMFFGTLKSAGLHVLFGAGAGLLGWGAYKIWRFKKDEEKSRAKAA
jgi:hypothetical protein